MENENVEKLIEKIKLALTEPVAESSDLHPEYVIVRAYSAGVHIGKLAKREGDVVTLKNSRRLWSWKGAADVTELGLRGVSRPDECKFPAMIAEITVLGVIEIVPCTNQAVESLLSVPVWSGAI